MPVDSVSQVEEIEAELIAVAAADPLGRAALSTLPSNEAVRFEPAEERRNAKSPAMLLAVGDGRGRGSSRAIASLRRPSMVNVAIVVVDSLRSAELRALLGDFDAVLPVVGGGDVETALTNAVESLTHFVRADRVAIPIDEAYPFFVDGGLLGHGSAEGFDIPLATGLALEQARIGASSRMVRVLLHLDTTSEDMMTDYELAAETVTVSVELEELWMSASVGSTKQKRVSIVARAWADPRVKA